MTAMDRAFWQGVAVVLYEAAKPPGGPSEAADLATRVGASLAIFRQARVNPPDVAPFRKELRAREQRGRQVTPADYCDAMARWWRDEASYPPVATREVDAAARAVFNEECKVTEYDGTSANEHHAAAWDRAAARLRGAK